MSALTITGIVAASVLAFAVVVLLAFVVLRWARHGSRGSSLAAYGAALVVTSLLLPGLVGVTVVGLFATPEFLGGILNGSGGRSLLIGVGMALALWLVVALFFRRYGRPEGANPSVYRELQQRYHEASDRLAASAALPNAHERPAGVRAAATSALTQAAEGLGIGNPAQGRWKPGFAWAAGMNYVSIRESIHRAEEALLELEADDAAICGALRDRECLRGSRIANANGLLADLETAARQLGGGRFFATRRTDAEVEPVAANAEEKRLARGVLAGIRRTINEFRNSRRGGLVRARNNLAVTVIFTGLTTLALLALALLAIGDAADEKARRTAVAVAATFYLIGAVVGLFRQLRAASAADAVIEEDYGLSHVRLIQVPLFSGLAALGGVIVTRLLIELNPGVGNGKIPSVADIFSFTENPLGLVAAAVFGLTPTLLVFTLQRRAEQWKEDLQTSAPAEGGAAPAAPPT